MAIVSMFGMIFCLPEHIGVAECNNKGGTLVMQRIDNARSIQLPTTNTHSERKFFKYSRGSNWESKNRFFWWVVFTFFHHYGWYHTYIATFIVYVVLVLRILKFVVDTSTNQPAAPAGQPPVLVGWCKGLLDIWTTATNFFNCTRQVFTDDSMIKPFLNLCAAVMGFDVMWWEYKVMLVMTWMAFPLLYDLGSMPWQYVLLTPGQNSGAQQSQLTNGFEMQMKLTPCTVTMVMTKFVLVGSSLGFICKDICSKSARSSDTFSFVSNSMLTLHFCALVYASYESAMPCVKQNGDADITGQHVWNMIFNVITTVRMPAFEHTSHDSLISRGLYWIFSMFNWNSPNNNWVGQETAILNVYFLTALILACLFSQKNMNIIVTQGRHVVTNILTGVCTPVFMRYKRPILAGHIIITVLCLATVEFSDSHGKETNIPLLVCSLMNYLVVVSLVHFMCLTVWFTKICTFLELTMTWPIQTIHITGCGTILTLLTEIPVQPTVHIQLGNRELFVLLIVWCVSVKFSFLLMFCLVMYSVKIESPITVLKTTQAHKNISCTYLAVLPFVERQPHTVHSNNTTSATVLLFIDQNVATNRVAGISEYISATAQIVFGYTQREYPHSNV